MVLLNDVKNSNKATIIIHGISSKYQTQMEKLVKKGVKNGLNALESGVLPGYGIMYLLMADKIREAATLTGKKESIAMEGIAEAMDDIYKTLAANAGNDQLDSYLLAKKSIADKTINMKKTIPADLFLSELQRAKESSIGMLRTDEVLSAKPLYRAESFGGGISGVTIYTSDGCPWCARTKEYLRSRGISFREVNVSRDPSGIQEMMSVSGQTGTPVTVIKGESVVGFDEARLDALT
jgi:glutaredoxin-like YruB-family protein